MPNVIKIADPNMQRDVRAIGFGNRVEGGGPQPVVFEVTSGANAGPGTLQDALDQAAARRTGTGSEIVIKTAILPNTKDLTVRAKHLTLRAVNGSVITKNHLVIDCTQADDVLLRDLRFESDGQGLPRDTISIAAREGRGPTGIWIDHCSFEAYFDLNITSNTRDLAGAPPLLMTISNCHFHDRNPSGSANRNHGSLGIHGTGRKDPKTKKRDQQEDQSTNTYATVCRNYFETTRRRSPRSANRTFVHAFNNVLVGWGGTDAGPKPDQQNGMSAGHFGILAAEANYFEAGVFKPTIEIARREAPRLYVGKGALANLYVNGAEPASDFGTPAIVIADEYSRARAPLPSPEAMTANLATAIKNGSGPVAGASVGRQALA